MPRVRNIYDIYIDAKDLQKLNETIDVLKLFDEDVVRRINNQTDIAVRNMIREAPVDTGRLQRQIVSERISDNSVIIFSEAIDPDTGVDYAPIQDQGGRHNRPTYYFTRNINKYVFNVMEDLRKSLIRVLKGAPAGAKRAFKDLTTRN